MMSKPDPVRDYSTTNTLPDHSRPRREKHRLDVVPLFFTPSPRNRSN
jgi:hypothetical protein